MPNNLLYEDQQYEVVYEEKIKKQRTATNVHSTRTEEVTPSPPKQPDMLEKELLPFPHLPITPITETKKKPPTRTPDPPKKTED